MTWLSSVQPPWMAQQCGGYITLWVDRFTGLYRETMGGKPNHSTTQCNKTDLRMASCPVTAAEVQTTFPRASREQRQKLLEAARAVFVELNQSDYGVRDTPADIVRKAAARVKGLTSTGNTSKARKAKK